MSMIVRAIKEVINAVKDDTNKGAAEFRACGEDELFCYHHTLGCALRNGNICDSLLGDNDLTREFKEIGIWHADDMSHVLITAAHRIINNRSVNLRELREFFHDHWQRFGIDPWTGEEVNDHNRKIKREVQTHGSDND